VLAIGASAPDALAAWSRPFLVAPPTSLDLFTPQVGFSPGGAAAITFDMQDADVPSASSGMVVQRTSGGRLSKPHRIPGAKSVLASSFNGERLDLLTGAAGASESCCSSTKVIGLGEGGRFGGGDSLVGRLAGATEGRLLTFADGRMVAAIATERGVWVAQSSGGDNFPGTFRLTNPGTRPEALAAASMPGDASFVAWTATTSAGASGPTRIFLATGSQTQGPRGALPAVTVTSGHRIDELVMAPGASSPTVAWVESWYDARSRFHSELRVGDLSGTVRPRTISRAGQLASGVSIAGDPRGDQAVSYKACASSDSCSVGASVRRAGGRFSSPQSPGSIDASQSPAVTVSPQGRTLLGWIKHGHVFAAARGSTAGRFGRTRLVAGTSFGSDLALGFGPSGEAIAAWVQGTLAPSVFGAVYRG
jgi:hypothetical protein